MKYNSRILLFFLLLGCHTLCAQMVLYSSVVNNGTDAPVEVAGKTENFYWAHKTKTNRFKKRNAAWTFEKSGAFEVYDARLNRVKEISYTLPDSVFEQYLVAGGLYFDQLLFVDGTTETRVVLNRYTQDGQNSFQSVPLHSFPASLKANDFLLVRSQDKRKLLLLGFESVAGATPRVHAALYDWDWNLLHQTVYHNPDLTQPFIQYDFTNYPLEDFDNSPLKLANNGDWMTVAPSRHTNNYILFHFQPFRNALTQNELKGTQSAAMRLPSLSLNNDTPAGLIGILLNTGASVNKKVRIAHYNAGDCRFDFDTLYRINTVAATKSIEENLFENYFMPVPGKGFLFLKEYGRPYHFTYAHARETSEEDSLNTEQVSVAFTKNAYTRYDNLSGALREYSRGDLRLYFFPATPRDTCWSGLLNQPQTGELNTPSLSYACMPFKEKIIFLYNSTSGYETRSGNTTALDGQGNSLNEEVLFWKSNRMLDFQKAKRLTAREMAVPYDRSGVQGFAVIRLY